MDDCSSGNQSKEIVMQLTKDEDPLFFYTHRMTEQEFRHFKVAQDLKVDFVGFPQMVRSLLESVLVDESKFYLTFDENGACDGVSDSRRVPAILKIVQSAGHKNLTHLALKFYSADPKDIQAYLSGTIRHLKRRLSVLEKQCRQLESDHKRQCESLEERVSKRTGDLETLKKEHESAMAKLKEETEKERQELQWTSERERAELEEKCANLQEENRDLHERLQGSNADVESVREEFHHLNDEVAQMRQRLEDYRREVIEMEKIRNELQTRLESAEEDAETKDNDLEQTKEHCQALLDQKRKLEHTLHEWTNRAKKFEDLYNVQSEETEKAVQIMQKCVSYSNSCKEKGTKAELIARKQQELLKSKESEVSKLRSENEGLANEVDELKKENKSLTTTASDLRRQLQEQAGSLVEKEALLVNMSKQLAEFRLLVNPGGVNRRHQPTKDYVPVFPSPPSLDACVASSSSSKDLPAATGDRRSASTSEKTFGIASGGSGKENKTPFLHPKYSARS